MYKTFSQIKLLFNKYKTRASKQFNIDLSKTHLYLGKLSEFPKIRNLAYTTVEKTPKVYISPKLKFQTLDIIKAILLHELAHVIFILKKQKHTERQTDNLAKKILGRHLYYDKNDIQTITKTTKRQRPKYLKK